MGVALSEIEQDGKTALQVALEKARDASHHSYGIRSTTSTSPFEEICIKLLEAGSDVTATDKVSAHHMVVSVDGLTLLTSRRVTRC